MGRDGSEAQLRFCLRKKHPHKYLRRKPTLAASIEDPRQSQSSADLSKKFGDRYNLEGGEVGIEEPFFVPVLCLTVPGYAQGRSAAKAYFVICSVLALGEPNN